MERLIQREMQRYGIERISHGVDMHKGHKVFCEWAAAYETGSMEMRSLTLYKVWKGRLQEVIFLKKLVERSSTTIKAHGIIARLVLLLPMDVWRIN